MYAVVLTTIIASNVEVLDLTVALIVTEDFKYAVNYKLPLIKNVMN